ncbi:MAG TPA: D-alanine--D-alanine ligase [Gemmatimonadales bacterium]
MKITVLTGGASAERDVALASARQIVPALRSRDHRVVVVDTVTGFVPESREADHLLGRVGTTWPSVAELQDRERTFLLTALGALPEVREVDVVFLALHGGRGEDGTVQTILETIGVPYTGSGPIASGIAMDKDVSKRLFRDAGVPTPAWAMAPIRAGEAGRQFGWPLVVKPSKQGSTVGLTIVQRPEDFDRAVWYAGEFDDEVMIEAFVPGRELTVGVLEDRSLAVGEIIPKHEIFDYECKYTPGMSEEIFPAALTEEVTRECQRLGLRAHRALKLGGYSRVDFRLTPDGRLLCLEVNTLPGMTATSLLPQSAGVLGIDFAELCDRICRTARRPERTEQGGSPSGFTS